MARRTAEFNDWLRDTYPVRIGDLDLDPVDVLHQYDSDAYEDQLLEWNNDREILLQEVLSATSAFKGNADRIARLRQFVAKGAVIPFVGAGLSVPCGIQTWAAFVISVRNHLNAHSLPFEEAVAAGDLETAAELAAQDMGDELFRERVRARLQGPGDRPVRGPLILLPELFDGPILTTNLDRHIEKAYTEAGLQFDDIIRGDLPSTVEGLIAERRRLLVKVHGDELYPDQWILRENQYDLQYGTRNSPDMSLPLPHALAAIFRSGPVLFIGCSLQFDRTLEVLREVCRSTSGGMPDHFAILEAPLDDGEWDEREIALAKLDIFPIWFPPGEYDAVEAVLLGLSQSAVP